MIAAPDKSSKTAYLPRMRFVKVALTIGHYVGKLAGGNIRLPDAAHEGRMCLEHRTMVLMGIENSNWQIFLGNASIADALGQKRIRADSSTRLALDAWSCVRIQP